MPNAFFVLQPAAITSEFDLIAFFAERVAPYKKVRRVEFVDSIPRSPTGKILRRLLVEHERQHKPT